MQVNTFKLFMAFACALLLAACGTEVKKGDSAKKQDTVVAVKKVDPLVKPPFNGISIPWQEVEVDADSGRVFFAGNGYGTRVEVPGGVFIDSAGVSIEGKVLVRYRELHTMNEMLISGAPLSYDAAGMLKRFSTGGMFEIRAAQGDKEVFLDSGKVIQVSMASFEAGSDYHSFYLDEDKVRNWIYLKDLKGKANPEKKKILARARSRVNELQLPLSGYFAFNYMALLDVYLNDKTVEIKKKRADLTLQGQIKEYGVEWTNIYCYQSIEYNGTKTLASLLMWKKLNKEAWPVWTNTATCNLVAGAEGNYTLELTHPKGKPVYKATIKPYQPIKALLSFSPSYWRNKYNLALRKVIDEEMRRKKVADVFQAMEVHRFGFYNIDKLQGEEDYVQVAVEPDFAGALEAVNDVDLYYMSEQYRAVIRYPREEWGNITLLPDGGGKLFAVLPGNKLVIAEGESLRKLNYRELKAKPGTVVKLKFTLVNTPVNTVAEIAKALGIQEVPL